MGSVFLFRGIEFRREELCEGDAMGGGPLISVTGFLKVGFWGWGITCLVSV